MSKNKTDKRTAETLTVIKKLKRRFQAKRRVKNFSLLPGLIFELFRTQWPVKESIRRVTLLEKKYVDWNEFRVTRLEVIRQDLGLSVGDLRFLAQVKRVLQNVYDALASFSVERFEQMTPSELIEFFEKTRIDAEIAAVALAAYMNVPVVALPDDVMRFIKRLGTFPNKSSRKRVRTFFQKMVEQGLIDAYQTYRLFQEQAEINCLPKDPDCRHCPVDAECRSARRF